MNLKDLETKMIQLDEIKHWVKENLQSFETIASACYPNNKIYGVKAIKDFSIFPHLGGTQLGLREAKAIADEIFEKLKREEEKLTHPKNEALRGVIEQCLNIDANFHVETMERVIELLKGEIRA